MYLSTTTTYKKYIRTLLVSAIFVFYFFCFPTRLLAADCTVTADGLDFHSFRPYPGEPCNEEFENLSLLCGNDMRLTKEFQRVPSQGSCQNTSGNNYSCTFVDVGHIKAIVDTSESQLPIMGNTELVTNRDNPNDQINDAVKMNDFVSWYLNGAVNYAENPHPIEDMGSAIEEWWSGYYKNAINYSGPIRKLLSQDSQYQYKIEQVEKAKNSQPGDKDAIHDQVVGCTYSLKTPFFFLEQIINLLLKAYGVKINIPGSKIGNIIGPCVDLPWYYDLFNVQDIHRMTEWSGKKLPPLIEDYDDPSDPRAWWVAYERWRGKSCIVLPGWKIIPKFLRHQGICIENYLKLNYYADLFMNFPISSMEDRKGKLTIKEPPDIDSGEMKVDVSNFVLIQPATLYFPHMLETAELTSKLQDTYMPKDGTNNDPGYSEKVDISSDCVILQVRTGDTPGDSLYGNQAIAEFDYEATFSCDFSYSDQNPSCTKRMTLTSKIDTETPLADSVWNKLVNGNSSIVRRMFPKLNDEEIGSLIDFPTSTTAKYLANGASASPANADIYFPHIGAIDEYFLKGIQTLLRPKGYGEDITFGEPIEFEPGDCSFNLSAINSAIQKAAAKYNVPASMLKAIFEIEALPYIANPSSYVCQENSVGAAGVMGITKSAYNIVTCDNERLGNDIGVCGKTAGKLSRCNIDDTFELAARIILWKAGKWVYGPGNCYATGGLSTSNKMEIYNAAWKYYGSNVPDNLTKQYSYNLPGQKRPDPPGMSYADIVCNKMLLCPSYPPQ